MRKWITGLWNDLATEAKNIRSVAVRCNLIGFFVFSCIVGIIIHLPMIVLGLNNHDSICIPFNNLNWLISQGKWFTTPLSSMEGPYDIPYLAGLICIVVFSLAATIVVCMINTDSRIVQAIICISIVGSPAVATGLTYHAGDYFGTAFLLATAGAFLITRKGLINFLVGLLLTCLSIGAYQANVSVALMVLIIDYLLRLYDFELTNKSLIKRAVKYGSAIISSTLAYYVILKVFLRIRQTGLSSYKGIDNMSSILSVKTLFNSAKTAYKLFCNYFLRNNLGLTREKPLIWGILLVGFLMLAWLAYFLICLKKGKQGRSILLFIILLIGVPLGANSIGVLSQNASYYHNSIASFSLVIFLPLILLKEADIRKEDLMGKAGPTFFKAGLFLCVIVSACLNFKWVIEENTVYQKIRTINEEFDAKMPILISNIQNVEGFTVNSEVVIVGNAPYDYFISTGILAEYDSRFNTLGYGLGNGAGEIYSEGILRAFLQNKYSININISGDDYFLDDNIDIVEDMSVYPAEGSIRNVNGMIIVKMSENY